MKINLLTLLALHLGLAAVVAQPVITNQPQSQTNIVGATVTFTVGATGAPPLSYQWRSHASGTSFTNIPWGTEATLVLTNVQLTSRRFAVVITDAGGLSATSSPLVTLTLVTPPSITPANPTASLFADVALFATNGSTAPLSYQWLFNGEPIAGAVTNRLVVTNVKKTNAGGYAIVSTYAVGSATSQVAMLKITPFNSLYCFGHSWTDTHNPFNGDPVLYYHNHACNGPMWPEYLSTNFGFAYDQARNFAVGGASSADVLNLQIPQLSNPADARLALFVVWPLEGDFAQAEFANPNLDQLATNNAFWNGVIRTMVQNTTNAIVALYGKGARSILIPSMAAYGLTPGIGTSSDNTRSNLNQWSASGNVALAAALDNLESVKPDLRILRLDFYSKFNQVLAAFSDYGFTKVLPPALLDLALLDKSFTGPGTNYVWWDGRHGTTKTHGIWTSWIYDLVTHASLERLSLTVNGNTASLRLSKLNIGRDYTLQTSSDLKNWNDVETFTASAGTNQVPQPLSAIQSSIFFRLQWQQ